MAKVSSAIPVGTGFSPDILDFQKFVAVLAEFEGSDPDVPNEELLLDAIWSPGVRKPLKDGAFPTYRVQSLPLEAAVQYGLVEKTSVGFVEFMVSGKKTREEMFVCRPTAIALQLAKLTPPALYEEFGKHILLSLGGLRVLEGLQQMEIEKRPITADSFARYMTQQGFPIAEHNTAINTMRLWLAYAGLFPVNGRDPNAWKVDSAVKEKLLGMTDETISVLASLTSSQIEFVNGLCRVDPQGWIPATEIRDNVETLTGIRYGRGSLPNEVLEPLKQAGLIEYETDGTAGGKTSRLRTTDLFNAEVLEPFVSTAIKFLDPVVTAYFKKRPEDIYADMDSSDTYVKGAALEAYAVYIMRLLGLRFIAWRKRAKDSTGGGEIDALLAGTIGMVPTRWQVQCKNLSKKTGVVDLEDVAKEVGLLPITKSSHVLFINTGRFTRDARIYAEGIMENSSAVIFLLDGSDFEKIKANPGIVGVLLRQQSEAFLERIFQRERAEATIIQAPSAAATAPASIVPAQNISDNPVDLFSHAEDDAA